jgi:hypothetical protein
MRYEDVTQDVNDLLNSIIKEHFPNLINARFKCVFDTKKKMKGGKFTFAYIKKVNDFITFLANDEFDYVAVFDKNIWNAIQPSDRTRVARHELRHCFIDGEADDPYKLVDHEIEDFYDEIILNADDPKWSQRVAAVAESVYARDKEDQLVPL